MRKRLPNDRALAIDRNGNQPVPCPLEVRYSSVLELSVTIWTEDEQVGWVMTDLWVKMMYFKVRLTIAFFECKRAQLALSIVQFSKQNANPRGHPLVALSRTRRYPWARLARRLLGNLQQLFSD